MKIIMIFLEKREISYPPKGETKDGYDLFLRRFY
jgi:hypothetical protein